MYYGHYLLTCLIWKHTPERAFRLRIRWCKIAKFILGVRTEYDGHALNETALYICNHRSLVDPIITAKGINAWYVAKAEVDKYPVFGKAAEKTGVIFVDRSSKSSRSATVDTMKKHLREGRNIFIFPEGTTKTSRYTGEYRLGSFRVAAELGIPVVPVVLEYRDEKDLWTIDNIFKQYFKQFRALRTYTKMHIGPAIKGSDPQELMEEIRNYTDRKLQEMHKNWTTFNYEDVASNEHTV